MSSDNKDVMAFSDWTESTLCWNGKRHFDNHAESYKLSFDIFLLLYIDRTLAYLLRVARSSANPKVLLYKRVVDGMGNIVERLAVVLTRIMQNSQYKMAASLVIASE